MKEETPEVVEIWDDNVQEWGYYTDGQNKKFIRHRNDDEPASINHNTGDKFWFKHGVNHREHGKPARVNENTGYRVYVVEGMLYREDGPAAIYPDENGGFIYRYYEVPGALHRENGPARWGDDGKIGWFIQGKDVDEQIVMRPETQTIDQIVNEPDIEKRRIRAERFGGWPKVLSNANTSVIEEGWNNIEQTKEALVELFSGNIKQRFLMGACPSTGREYAMEVDPIIHTIYGAKSYLNNDIDPNNIILAT